MRLCEASYHYCSFWRLLSPVTNRVRHRGLHLNKSGNSLRPRSHSRNLISSWLRAFTNTSSFHQPVLMYRDDSKPMVGVATIFRFLFSTPTDLKIGKTIIVRIPITIPAK